jgi:hypothetical protein
MHRLIAFLLMPLVLALSAWADVARAKAKETRQLTR